MQHMLKAFEVGTVEAGDDHGMCIGFGHYIHGIVPETILALVGREETIQRTVVYPELVFFQQVAFQRFAWFVLPVAGCEQAGATDYKYKNVPFHRFHLR